MIDEHTSPLCLPTVRFFACFRRRIRQLSRQVLAHHLLTKLWLNRHPTRSASHTTCSGSIHRPDLPWRRTQHRALDVETPPFEFFLTQSRTVLKLLDLKHPCQQLHDGTQPFELFLTQSRLSLIHPSRWNDGTTPTALHVCSTHPSDSRNQFPSVSILASILSNTTTLMHSITLDSSTALPTSFEPIAFTESFSHFRPLSTIIMTFFT